METIATSSLGAPDNVFGKKRELRRIDNQPGS